MRVRMFEKSWLMLGLCSVLLGACGTGMDQTQSSQLNNVYTETQGYPLGRAILPGRNIELKKKNSAGWFNTIARGSWVEVISYRASAQLEFDRRYRFEISPVHIRLNGPGVLLASDSCTKGVGGEESDGGKNNNSVALTCTNGNFVIYVFPKREDRIRIRQSEYRMVNNRRVLIELAEFEIDTQE